jgi:N-acetylmuramoyl-L-alanine amidase
MVFKTSALLLAGLLYTATSFAQSNLLQRAQAQYAAAQELEKALNEAPVSSRSRSDYVRVISAYERVYLITPRTSFADNALMTIANLYEQIDEIPAAIRTLNFLIREYPQTPFRDEAREFVARLQSTPADSPVSAVVVPASSQTMTAVDNLRYWEAQNSVRVVVDVSGEITFKQGEAQNPDRVFIDIAPARLNAALVARQWPVKSGLLQQIRVGQYDNSTVRVVLDLGTIGRVTAFTLSDPNRLVIDILGEGEQPQTAAVLSQIPVAAVGPATNTNPPSAPIITPAPSAPAAKSPVAAQPVAVTPAKPTNRGDRSLIRSLGLKLSKVVIDAGHGGHDTGSIGPSGYTEKELVLDVARRLKDLIEKELGAEVVMTRTEDVFVPLEARTAIANQHEADLFVSIHANSSKVKTVRGVETFFLNLPSSREALEIASRENAASQKAIHELQDVVRQIMLSDKVEESRELARHIQNAMAGRKGAGQNRGVKQAPFVVLIGANMPSILAEIGFISNPQEERSIKTAQYRQQIAESLFEGVRSYSETLSGIKTARSQEKD